MQWAEEIQPTLVILARHGSHRIAGTSMGSQAENLVRLLPYDTLVIGTTDVRPDEIPWIEEDGETGLEWEPSAEVRILRVPPFALGIARKAVEEWVLEKYGAGNGDRITTATAAGVRRAGTDAGVPVNGDASESARTDASATSSGNGNVSDPARTDAGPIENGNGNGTAGSMALPVVTNARLDEAIRALLPTHMQLIMGIGTAEELALAEVKAQEAMKRTAVEGSDADAEPAQPMVEARCPYTGHVSLRARTAADPVVWTAEAFERLRLVPLIARPLARNTVERFAKDHDFWRITTRVMDENKQAMIEADTFDMDTMLVMFKELQAKQLRAAAEGVDGLTPEMRKFIDEAKAAGVTRCPIRDVEAQQAKCPVDFKTVTPEAAKQAVADFLAQQADAQR
jgi:hypothetical protein